MSIPEESPFFARINPIACIIAPKTAKTKPLNIIFFFIFLSIKAIDVPQRIKTIPKKFIILIFSFKKTIERNNVMRGDDVKESIESCGPKIKKLLNKKRSPNASPIIPLKER